MKNDWAGEGAGWEEEDLLGMGRFVKHRSGGRQGVGRGQGPRAGGEPRMPDGATEPREGL